MGRQIQVILNRADEDLLLQRLRKDGDVRVFEFFAAAPDSLWVSHFNDQASGHLTYRFWPVRFAWRPTYAWTTTGQAYVNNTHTAPVLEYTRPPRSNDRPGRLYWSHDFAGNPEYDDEAFGKWIDSIFRWVRTTAVKKALYGFDSVWVFPGAGAQLS